ncbi:hypothetical protein BKA69DRAFT_1125284 [Paraphysoderma sedebokerense]|nr:hypothetical protein BKA69DRAFT_1125284 [Paraphysoderma sedebokerense]
MTSLPEIIHSGHPNLLPHIHSISNSHSSPPVIDFRSVEQYLKHHIVHSFSIPLVSFRDRSVFPWFLLPPKSSPFVVVIHSPTEITSDDSNVISLLETRLGEPINPDSYKFQPENSVYDQEIDLLRYLLTKGWQITHAVLASPALFKVIESIGFSHLLASCPPSDTPLTQLPRSVIASMRLPFEPNPVLRFWCEKITQHLNQTLAVIPSDSHDSNYTCLDLGCGAGRDVAWLLHQYPSWGAIAVDSWKGSIDRVNTLLRFLKIYDEPFENGTKSASRSRIVHAKCTNSGIVSVNSNPQSCNRQVPISALNNANLILMVRFLPPRSFLPYLHSLIKRHTFILIHNFILPSVTWTLESWVQNFKSPLSFENLLAVDELTNDVAIPIPEADSESSVDIDNKNNEWKKFANAEKKLVKSNVNRLEWNGNVWGWGFNPNNGYRIWMNEIRELDDGRSCIWFLAEKIA